MTFLNKKTTQTFLGLGISILLTNCSALDSSKIAPGYKETYLAMRNAIFGFPELEISPETIQNIPYASMLLQIGKGPNGLVILERKRGQQYVWVSADEIYLVLKKGKIVETRGLSNNLIDTFQSSLPFKEIIGGEVKELQGYYSYDNPPLRNLSLNFEYEVIGKELVQILGSSKELLRIEEKGISEILGWKFTNIYWVDENYLVWKSSQTLSPKLPKINYTVTKKPSI